MREYLTLLRFDLLKLRNYFVEIRRTPKKLVSFFLFLAWLVLILLPAFQNRNSAALRLGRSWEEIILGAYSLLVILFFFMSANAARRKLTYAFGMGDVNLLFPSPLEPNRILLWSLLKKTPVTLAQSILPIIFLTPTLVNSLSLGGREIFLVYLSVVSLALLLTPLNFLIFLVSARYQKEIWVRTLLILAGLWLAVNWFLACRGSLTGGTLGPGDLLLGYRAPGVLFFPFTGWIIQLAASAFFGVTAHSYAVLALVVLSLAILNYLVFRLARDYYEDVLDYAALVEALRAAKRSGGLGKNQLTARLSGRFTRKLTKEVKGKYPGAWAFMFRQVAGYRRTGVNEYIGYLTLLALLTGLLLGFVASRWGFPAQLIVHIMNGIIVYTILLGSLHGPVSLELGQPYLYTLPGSFFRKSLAINTLPVVRFALNVLLLNGGLLLLHREIWSSTLLIALVVISVYFEQSNLVVVGQLLLPSSLDRKVFYPLYIFVQILLIALPDVIVGILIFALSHSEEIASLGIALTNVGLGGLLLALSDRIFPYLEMREFDEA